MRSVLEERATAVHAGDGPAPIVCEHCDGPVPQVSLRVASLDGTTLVVMVAERGLVREVKRLVAQVRRERVPNRGNRRRH